MTAPDRAPTGRAQAGSGDDRAVGVAARLAVLGTVWFAVVAAIYALSAHTARGQRLGNALFDARADQLRGRNTAIEILATMSVWSLVAAIAAAMAVALVRGRPRLALAAGSVIGISILATEALKHLILTRPHLDPSAMPWHLDNVFPSGHTTIGMATAVAFVLVVPSRMRGAAAVVGAVYATAIAASTLDAAWHRTSDALGAIFLVGGTAAWACAGLVLWRGTGPRHTRRRLWAYAPLSIVAALGTLVVVVGSPATVRAIDRGTLRGVGVREGQAVAMAAVAVAVSLVMAVLLAALQDVSLDAPPTGAKAPPAA